MITLTFLTLMIICFYIGKIKFPFNIRNIYIQYIVAIISFTLIILYTPQFINKHNILLIIISFFLFSIYLYIYNILVRKHNQFITKTKNQNSSLNNELKNLKKKEISLSEEITNLNDHLNQTSSIYNATINMSSTLDFFETMNAYIKSLSTLKGFSKLYLIIKNPGENNDENIYCGYFTDNKTQNVEKYMLGQTEEVLLKKMENETNIISIEDCLPYGLLPNSFGISSINKAMLAPLVFLNNFLGVLVYFNIYDTFNEQIEILSLHFAMEIHKSHLYEKIKLLSTIDSLTGVYLKRNFLTLFDEEIEKHKQLNLEFGVIVLDIDDFKNINDKFGHLVGDKVLQEIANIIKTNCREDDLIGRFGGDEFVIVLPKAIKEKSYQVALRIKNAVNKLGFKPHNKEILEISVSIGLAMFPHDGKTRKKLINSGDKAMYLAKKQGRNRVEFT